MPAGGDSKTTVALALTLATTAVLGVGCASHSRPTMPIAPTAQTKTPAPAAVPEASQPAAEPSAGSAAPEAKLVTRSASPAPPAADPESPSGPAAVPTGAAAKMAAAVETVRDFLDGINHEMDTGDSTPAVRVFTAGCLACIDDVASVHDVLAGGHTLRGSHVHFLGVQSTSVLSDQAVRIVVTQRQDGGVLLDNEGTITRRFTPAPPTMLAFSVDVKKSPPLIWQIRWLGR